LDFVPFKPSDALSAVGRWAGSINNQSKAGRVPPCALVAIVATETGGQNIFEIGVPQGPGAGAGLCQITDGVEWSNPDLPTFYGGGRQWGLMDPSSNLYVASRWFLAPAIDECLVLRERLPDAMNRWSPEILFYAFASYNLGFGGVRDALLENDNPDRFTSDSYATRAYASYKQYLAESHAAGAKLG